MSGHLGALSQAEIGSRLRAGLVLRIGPFNISLTSPLAAAATALASHYPDYRFAADGAFVHAGIRIDRARGRWWREQGIITLDDGYVFSDFPRDELLPYMEWAINWCVATRAHQFLMLHAATLEKHGKAIVFPGLPGVGKSTLAAYLAHNGWRLLSDEFCLLTPGTRNATPFPRLVPLKNDAIDVIGGMVPGVRMGPRFAGTRKGTVCHVHPPETALNDASQAPVALIVKPAFAAGAAIATTPMAASRCFVELSANAFNYQIMGRDGFDTVGEIAGRCPAYELTYGELQAAAERLEELLDAA